MPINQQITSHIINLLNQIHRQDPTALANLITHHTPCNNTLANHPTIQVRGYGPNPPTVGLLGILNGLCGTYDEEPKKGYGPITAQLTHDHKIIQFQHTRPQDQPEQPNPWQQLRKAALHYPEWDSNQIDQTVDLIDQYMPQTTPPTEQSTPTPTEESPMNKQQLNKLKHTLTQKRDNATKQAQALDTHCWPPSSGSAIWNERARHQGTATLASEILETIDQLENEEDIAS